MGESPFFDLGKKRDISAERFGDLKDRLIGLTRPIVQDHGADLVDLELVGNTNNQTVRLLVHKVSGVTVELCVAISREAADLLDVEDPIPGRYRLEVTSPGLDRPLVSDSDFGRALGRLVKTVSSNGETHLGRLLDWDGEFLTLEADTAASKGKRDGEASVRVERRSITRATIQAEL